MCQYFCLLILNSKYAIITYIIGTKLQLIVNNINIFFKKQINQFINSKASQFLCSFKFNKNDPRYNGVGNLQGLRNIISSVTVGFCAKEIICLWTTRETHLWTLTLQLNLTLNLLYGILRNWVNRHFLVC